MKELLKESVEANRTLRSMLEEASREYAKMVMQQTYGQVDHDLAVYMIKLLDSLLLTAPTVTVKQTAKAVVKHFLHLLSASVKKPGRKSQLQIDALKRGKLAVRELCRIMRSSLVKFNQQDGTLVLSVLQEISFGQESIAKDLAVLYRQNIYKLQDAILQRGLKL